MKLIPLVVDTLVVRWGLGLLSSLERPIEEEQLKPITLPEPDALEFTLSEQDWGLKEFNRQQTLRKEAAASRSQLKTRRLEELCRQLKQGKPKSEAWLVKYDEFLKSEEWGLIREQALRKAHFRCEYWECTRRARQAHLLEFPEGHMKPDFDWEKHKHILVALCCEHYMMVHRLVRKTIVRSNRQFVQFIPDSTKTAASHIPSAQALTKH